ncbi:MAG: pyridoxamine 5'-phosphate oxidase family protein [Dehalococcoidia bacterium]|jgi:nitroimidazol reductase NimA-like FMN-containing flavoprotein (pyridoxamine 5'-phosphate oxidase superfamily)
MPKLSEDEIKDFLTNFDYVMKLATLSSDGYPYVVPIWYFYEEEHFFILGRPNNKWVSNIYENQKISACIDSPSPPYARVSFRADAEVIDKEWFGEWEHLAHRYLGKEDGHKYYEDTKKVPRVLIRLKPSKLTSWGGGGWHPRYK